MSSRMSRYQKSTGYRNEPVYTVQETCKILNLEPSTLIYHFKRRRLKSFKIGGKRYYTKDSVNTFKSLERFKNKK